ncbi:MAG: hypothetical protein D084_Lepto4C00055G0003 [Leptospirillum sp. Group IV 'UBA BS']|nr:MAG: hypothetical protein D084_Lepto4C00055G0003 [Leptospirillum sp. Group IV 'UBA BS']
MKNMKLTIVEIDRQRVARVKVEFLDSQDPSPRQPLSRDKRGGSR